MCVSVWNWILSNAEICVFDLILYHAMIIFNLHNLLFVNQSQWFLESPFFLQPFCNAPTWASVAMPARLTREWHWNVLTSLVSAFNYSQHHKLLAVYIYEYIACWVHLEHHPQTHITSILSIVFTDHVTFNLFRSISGSSGIRYTVCDNWWQDNCGSYSHSHREWCQ